MQMNLTKVLIDIERSW